MNTELIDRVRNRLATEGTAVDAAAVANAARAESGGVAGHKDILQVVRQLRREFTGAGPLEPLLEDPGTTDVLVTAPDEVWVDGAAGLQRSEVTFPDHAAVHRLAQRLALSAGRRLDDAQPYVDGWLPGSGGYATVRLHAVLPPIAVDGPCVSLRVLRPAAHDLAKLHELGSVDAAMLAVLRGIVSARLAFLVSGATGAGKSTLLAAMLQAVPVDERIVTVEDVGELRPPHPQLVRLVARAANVEGAGEITLRQLIREALRMRPDRIVVGEARGAEVCELLAALNTGHNGSAGTVHANSPEDVPARLEALAALGGMSPTALHSQLGAAVHLVLHMTRAVDGTRRLSEIGVLRRDTDGTAGVAVRTVWRNGQWTRDQELLRDLLAERMEQRAC